MLRLRDMMTTDLLTVSPTTTLREAAELLSTRHIGGAPVVDGPTLVGVVSASDILAFAAAANETPAEPAAADEWEELAEWTAWDSGDDPPARFFTETPTVAELAQLEDVEGSASGADVLDRHTVAEVMTYDVVALPPSADGVAAAERLRAADVHRVLVVDGDRLVGIVTTSDITRAVADGQLVRRTYVFDSAR